MWGAFLEIQAGEGGELYVISAFLRSSTGTINWYKSPTCFWGIFIAAEIKGDSLCWRCWQNTEQSVIYSVFQFINHRYFYESQTHLFGKFSDGNSKATHSHSSVSYEFSLTECLFFREHGLIWIWSTRPASSMWESSGCCCLTPFRLVSNPLWEGGEVTHFRGKE